MCIHEELYFMRTKKPRPVNLPLWWNMRVSKQDRSRWKKSAAKERLDVSAWVRNVCNEACGAKP